MSTTISPASINDQINKLFEDLLSHHTKAIRQRNSQRWYSQLKIIRNNIINLSNNRLESEEELTSNLPQQQPPPTTSTPLLPRPPMNDFSSPSTSVHKPLAPVSCSPRKENVKRKRDGEDDAKEKVKERPSYVESGFKLASNKPILLGAKAQKRVENLVKQYANMEINLSDLESGKQKIKASTSTSRSYPGTPLGPMKDISNTRKPILSCNMDIDDDGIDDAADEFLRNLDISSLVEGGDEF